MATRTDPAKTEIGIVPISPRIGAEVCGVDLSQPLAEDQVAAIRQALLAHHVIFFRDQPLEIEQLKRLGRSFGPLYIHSGVSGLIDHPEVLRIHADGASTYVAGEDWHSDLSCDPAPPMGSILYLQTVPGIGGDTLFANMHAAYDALSERMKAHLKGLHAVHDGARVFAAFSDPARRFPRSRHPVIQTHRETGRKAIYVNRQFTSHIEGLPRDESDALLAYLYAHCMKPRFQARFRWERHSIAFWDNRAAQHMEIWDYFPEIRSGYRVIIADEDA